MVEQLPIKVGWRDAPLTFWDFRRSNEQKLLANVAISLHLHPHLHQSILPVLSCGVELLSTSQLFSSSDTKDFLRIAFRVV